MNYKTRIVKKAWPRILLYLLSLAILLYTLEASLKLALADDPVSSLLNQTQEKIDKPIWQLIKPNLFFGKIPIGKYNPLFESELYLLRFKLENYNLKVALASQITGKKTAKVEELVLKTNGIAGINANFFDTDHKPLGLIVQTQDLTSNLMHKGGKLLTGVFQIKKDLPSIIHRSDYAPDGITLAVQAGPRIIADRKLISFSENEPYSRRSGIAITSFGEIIFYATTLRFPGSSMTDIQNALMNTGLQITDALNLDGGGSSQFFVKSENNDPQKNISISGGDEVPIALVITEK